MFCVVECETTPPIGHFRRLFRKKQPGYRAAMRKNPSYCHLILEFPLDAPLELCRKRALAGLALMARNGCVGVVLPRDFPFPALPGQLGMEVSSAVPLYRRLAGRLCHWAADQMCLPREDLCVMLYGRRMTAELLEAAVQLSHRARSFVVDAGADTEAFCHGLRQNRGISPLLSPKRPVQLYVLMDVPPTPLTLCDDALVLNFSGGHPALLGGSEADGALLDPPRYLWTDWPERCETAALLAAMAASGVLRLDEVGIRGLTYQNQALPLRPRLYPLTIIG